MAVEISDGADWGSADLSVKADVSRAMARLFLPFEDEDVVARTIAACLDRSTQTDLIAFLSAKAVVRKTPIEALAAQCVMQHPELRSSRR